MLQITIRKLHKIQKRYRAADPYKYDLAKFCVINSVSKEHLVCNVSFISYLGSTIYMLLVFSNKTMVIYLRTLQFL